MQQKSLSLEAIGVYTSLPAFELIYNTSFTWCRLDKLISEAINNLKEPRGSDRAAIAMYIEVLMHVTFESKCWTILYMQ